MKKYNISKPEKYSKDGQEKTYWANIGTMTEFEKQDGSISRIIEIPAISLKASVFPIENKEVVEHKKEPELEGVEYEVDGKTVSSADIPF